VVQELQELQELQVWQLLVVQPERPKME